MTVKLHPFQVEGVKRIHELDLNCLLADQMGLGKTVQALKALADRPDLRPAVIVCPASLKLGWEDQAMQHLGMRIEVLSGRGPRTNQPPWLVRPNVVVVNYDVLRDWMPWLKKIEPKIVVGDEVQYIANPTAQRTRAMRELVDCCDHFIAISATPLTIRPIQLWTVLNMLDPKTWRSRDHYGLRYCGGRRTPWGMDYSRATNTKHLNKILLDSFMIRRLKTDVLKDLPAKTRNVVPFAMNSAERKEYLEAKGNLIAWLAKNYGTGVAKRASKVEAMAEVGHLNRLAARLKMRQAVDWIKDFLDSGEKLIVAAINKSIIKTLCEEFKGRFVKVTGDTPEKERHAAFKRFNKDPKCELFFGNIKAAGVGWSSSACSNVAFLQYPWSSGDLVQMEDRCHGIGRGQQGIPTTSHWLTLKETIEMTMIERLQRSQAVLDAILDGRKVENFDVFDSVVKSIR